MPQGGAALVNAGSRTVASLIAALVPVYAYKAADQQYTNTTLANDTDLSLPVTANFGYSFSCYLNFEGASGNGNGLSWTWAVPANSTLRYQAVYTRSSDAANVTGTTYVGTATVSALCFGAGSLCGASMTGTLYVAGSAGTLQLKACQAGTSATATIIHGQSFLSLQRIF